MIQIIRLDRKFKKKVKKVALRKDPRVINQKVFKKGDHHSINPIEKAYKMIPIWFIRKRLFLMSMLQLMRNMTKMDLFLGI